MKLFAAVVLFMLAFSVTVPLQAQYSGSCASCVAVIAVSDVTGQTSSQGSVTLVSSIAVSGDYMIRWYADVSVPCSTSPSGMGVTFTFAWTDATRSRNVTSTALAPTNSNGIGNFISGVIPIYAAALSTVSYSSSYMVTCSGIPFAYDVHVSVERTPVNNP